MSNNFNQMREEMLQILAKNIMRPISDGDLDALIKKYGRDEIIDCLEYLVAKKMVQPNCLVKFLSGDKEIVSQAVALTADGYDIATDDELGYKISSVNIRIHSNTLNQLADMINSSGLKAEEKQTLLSKIKEKGADHVIGRCIDLAFSSAPTATAIFLSYLKNAI